MVIFIHFSIFVLHDYTMPSVTSEAVIVYTHRQNRCIMSCFFLWWQLTSGAWALSLALFNMTKTTVLPVTKTAKPNMCWKYLGCSVQACCLLVKFSATGKGNITSVIILFLKASTYTDRSKNQTPNNLHRVSYTDHKSWPTLMLSRDFFRIGTFEIFLVIFFKLVPTEVVSVEQMPSVMFCHMPRPMLHVPLGITGN